MLSHCARTRFFWRGIGRGGREGRSGNKLTVLVKTNNGAATFLTADSYVPQENEEQGYIPRVDGLTPYRTCVLVPSLLLGVTHPAT